MKIASVIFLILAFLAAYSKMRTRATGSKRSGKWKVKFFVVPSNPEEWKPMPRIIAFWLVVTAYTLLYFSK